MTFVYYELPSLILVTIFYYTPIYDDYRGKYNNSKTSYTNHSILSMGGAVAVCRHKIAHKEIKPTQSLLFTHSKLDLKTY